MSAIDNYDDMSIVVEASVVGVATKTATDITTLITQLRASGANEDTIKALLLTDLTEGGRIFSVFKNGIKNTVIDGVGMVSSTAGMKVYQKAGVNDFRWVTVGSGSCDDCKSREGRTGSMKLFTTIGTPRSGWSVCRGHCRCRLVPVEYTGDTNIKRL
tara:strand:+ start:6179 stop:6652 length:474 start_codon:yes stop_codon:yes gene_type:complete